MKKFLLFATLFATAFATKAETFTVLNGETPVENGGYVIVTDYEDLTDLDGSYMYGVNLLVKNDNAHAERTYDCTLLWGTFPTKEQYIADLEEKDDYGYPVYSFGMPQMCSYPGECFPDNGDVNLGAGKITIGGSSPTQGLLYDLSIKNVDLVVEYKTTIVPVDDPSEVFECSIVYAPTEEAAKKFIDENAAVEDVIASDAAPVYYNLNGMKVEKPAQGLYIVKRGSKVTKEIIR